MPDLTWLLRADADTAFAAAMVAICWGVIAAALIARYGGVCYRAARRGVRWAGRWLVRAGRWAGRRWDAMWICPACQQDRRNALPLSAPRTYGDTR